MAVIVDSYSESNYNTLGTTNSARSKRGQSFECESRAILDSATFYIRRTGSPTGDVYAKLFAHSGTFGTSSVGDGEPLATSDSVDVTSLGTSVALKTFDFSGASRYLMETGYYVLVLEYNGGDSSNYVGFGMDTSSPTHHGNYCSYSDEWTASDSWDSVFYVYGELVGDSERGLYVLGIDEGGSERKLHIQGKNTDSSERGFYTKGKLGGDSERGLYTSGIMDGSALYKNLTIKKDNSAIRNRVYVRGGTYLSDTATIKQVADGQQTVFNLPEKPHELTVLEGATSKTVGIKNINDFTEFDYLMSYQEKYVETETAPVADTILTFTFKYNIPVLVAVEDRDSIEKYGQLEYIIFDKNIDTIAQARERALAELTDYAETIIEGSFETETTGFKAGQSMTVKLSDLDIDETFIVKSVRAKSIGGGNFIYKINIVSAEMMGILGFLIGLLESDKNSLNISSDETVDEIKTMTTETFGITDGTPTVDLNTNPFKYDSNAEWDVGEWES